VLGPDDVIWVHDYHLMPLAKALRERGHENRIGFRPISAAGSNDGIAEARASYSITVRLRSHWFPDRG
jgi:Glycosyltransferase family 20